MIHHTLVLLVLPFLNLVSGRDRELYCAGRYHRASEVQRPGRKCECLDIADFFSLTFCFTQCWSKFYSIHLDFRNPRFSNIRVFDLRQKSNTKTWIFKVQDFQASVFQIREHFD